MQKNANYAKIILDVAIENPAARNLYEKKGFKIIKQKNLDFRKKNYGTYLMEKKLTA